MAMSNGSAQTDQNAPWGGVREEDIALWEEAERRLAEEEAKLRERLSSVRSARTAYTAAIRTARGEPVQVMFPRPGEERAVRHGHPPSPPPPAGRPQRIRRPLVTPSTSATPATRKGPSIRQGILQVLLDTPNLRPIQISKRLEGMGYDNPNLADQVRATLYQDRKRGNLRARKGAYSIPEDHIPWARTMVSEGG